MAIIVHRQLFTTVFCFGVLILARFTQVIQAQSQHGLNATLSDMSSGTIKPLHTSLTVSTTFAGTENLLLLGLITAVSIIILAICLYCFWPDQSPKDNWHIPSPGGNSLKRDNKSIANKLDNRFVKAALKFPVDVKSKSKLSTSSRNDFAFKSLPVKSHLSSLDVKKSTPRFSVKTKSSIKSSITEKEVCPMLFTSLYDNMENVLMSQDSNVAKENLLASVNQGNSDCKSSNLEPKKKSAKNQVLVDLPLKKASERPKMANYSNASSKVGDLKNDTVDVEPQLTKTASSKTVFKTAELLETRPKSLNSAPTVVKLKSGIQKVPQKTNLSSKMTESTVLSEVGSSSIMSFHSSTHNSTRK